MTKIGVISDIHGNYPALRAVIEEMEVHDVSAIICVGDILGISGFPAQTIELLQDSCDIIIKGNHDIMPFDGDPETEVFEVEKQVFFDETIEQQQSWIYQLPTMREIEAGVFGDWSLTIAHSYPNPSESSGHESGNSGVKPREYVEVGSKFDERLLLLGHTHMQHTVDLRSFGHEVVICNPGSVGGVYQDEAHFSIVDIDDYSVEEFAIPYDTDEKWSRIKQLEEIYSVSLLE